MYRFIVARCDWQPRETADCKFDLTVSCVKLFRTRREIFDNVWPTAPDGAGCWCEIEMHIGDNNDLKIKHLSGVVPGELLRDGYSLINKIDRAKAEIITTVVAILMKEAEERSAV